MRKIAILSCLILFISCNHADSQRRNSGSELSVSGSISAKINGVNFVAPPKSIDQEWTNDLLKVNVDWVALIPYAFSRQGLPEVNYLSEKQYWGESIEGIKTNVQQAHKAGLKVMIKPQVWMRGAWVGDFFLSTEAEWQIWEDTYRKYMMSFVKLADEEKVELICLGTEYRNSVRERPAFWKKLIKEVRKIYTGKLTYCANWDDYQDVSFWSDLDFIGISAYFPLSQAANPSVSNLENAWLPIKKQLQIFSDSLKKPILFAEYGYRSMDQPAWRSWEHEYTERPINNQAQANAYQALYEAFWNERWFAGGFAWKWYSAFNRMDTKHNHDWTPQNKDAAKIMSDYYRRAGSR